MRSEGRRSVRSTLVAPRPAGGTVLVGEPLETASVAVVVVHGRDQDPQWMLENLVRPLDLPHVAFILPAAQEGSWYPNRFFDPAEDNEPWVSEAIAVFEGAVALAGDAGIPVEHVVLAGFSQGACLVAEMLARHPRHYAGVAILTGGFFGTPDELDVPPASLDGLRVLITGHVDDSWVPVPCVEHAAELLRAVNADVDLVIHDDPQHRINDDEVAAVRRLLLSVGARAGSEGKR
jgi:phospholipase/carboxylesterase